MPGVQKQSWTETFCLYESTERQVEALFTDELREKM